VPALDSLGLSESNVDPPQGLLSHHHGMIVHFILARLRDARA